jgi:6-pyruvoyltetrahydropterin/6-carboxytetrahydropterin synthase
VIALTRCYSFPAAHLLANPSLSDAENRRIYGKCANPNGHGHNYGIEVTVTGEVDARSGRIADPAALDGVFDQRIRSRFARRYLNDDAVFSGDLVPTAESIARVIHDELAPAIAERTGARLVRVRVHETRRNSFDYGATT